jgi:hypothetical protein
MPIYKLRIFLLIVPNAVLIIYLTDQNWFILNLWSIKIERYTVKGKGLTDMKRIYHREFSAMGCMNLKA